MVTLYKDTRCILGAINGFFNLKSCGGVRLFFLNTP